MSVNPYTRYHYSTSELISKFKPALTNQFSVFARPPRLNLNGPAVDPEVVNFMAYEAVLPGTSYELGTVYGDRQGRTEYYPTRRSYPPVDVSFYVDKDYNSIRFFEGWINAISTNKGTSKDSFVTHYYPDEFKGEITIAKFERDFRSPQQRLTSNGIGGARPGSVLKYTLRNAFPSNLISIPVSYEGVSILKTTVTFQYDVYFFETIAGIENAEDVIGATSGDQGDSPPPPVGGGDVPNFLGNTPNELRDLQRAAFQKSINASGKSGSQFKSEAAQEIINKQIYEGLDLNLK